MELYNKEFVYFDWEDKLEGKKVMVSDDIYKLKRYVNGEEINTYDVSKSGDDTYPFRVSGTAFRFCYYDPYYEFRKAYLEGKQLQFRNYKGEWEDVDGVPLFTNDEYRIKPELRWHVVLSDEGTLGIAKTTHKPIYFTGTEEECKEWIDEHKDLTDIMKAWEEGKTIQYLHNDNWFNVADNIPVWGLDNTYRVKPDETFYAEYFDNHIVKSYHPIPENVLFQSEREKEVDLFIDDGEYLEEIIKAAREGKTIQFKEFGVSNDPWKESTGWDDLSQHDFVHYEYRIDECTECLKHNMCGTPGKRCECYCTKAHVPFDTLQELIDAWDKKHPSNANRPNDTMPLIWIKNKEKNRVYLITDFLFEKYYDCDVGTDKEDLKLSELFENYTFLDGSIIGKRG